MNFLNFIQKRLQTISDAELENAHDLVVSELVRRDAIKGVL